MALVFEKGKASRLHNAKCVYHYFDPLVLNRNITQHHTTSVVFVCARVVKIFRDILLSNPTYGGRATACHAMLQRAADRKEVSIFSLTGAVY